MENKKGHDLTIDEGDRKVYFTRSSQAMFRANLDGTQIETLVVSPAECPDGWSRPITGVIALDQARGHFYFAGIRMRAAAGYPVIYRSDLRPVLKPTDRPAPPRIAAIAPYEQGAGGELVLLGDGLADAVEVRFIDDSTGKHAKAKFHAGDAGRLAVTVPRLGAGCRLPVILVQTSSGVTMTLGTDVVVPDHGPGPYYEDVRSLQPADKDSWILGTNKPYLHERSTAGAGARVWLRTGLLAGNVESAVVYAQRGSSLSFGPKGMVTAFAKDDSYVTTTGNPGDDLVIFHVPFASFLYHTYYNTTVKRIPVPAIRQSFPDQSFRDRTD